jgi:hypothetical protein
LIRSLTLAVILGIAVLSGACSSLDETLAKPDADPQACATCHLDEFSRVRNPVHVGEKPTTCGVCHTQDDWHPSILNHSWTLTGAHAKAASCFECHKGDPVVFRGTPKLCFGCHAADYQRGPGHVAENYPTTCEVCHGTSAWKPILATAKVPPKTPPSVPPPESKSVPEGADTNKKPAKAKPHPTAASTASPTTTIKPPDATTGASPRH